MSAPIVSQGLSGGDKGSHLPLSCRIEEQNGLRVTERGTPRMHRRSDLPLAIINDPRGGRQCEEFPRFLTSFSFFCARSPARQNYADKKPPPSFDSIEGPPRAPGHPPPPFSARYRAL